jgi:hypothetical protein
MRHFVRIISIVLLTLFMGCGSGMSPAPAPPTPPPTPPQSQLEVVTPADGATVSGGSVAISVSATNIQDASLVTVLLDGVDVTARLSAPNANGARSIKVQPPDINYGKNQIQIRYEDQRVESSFIFDSSTSEGSGLPGVAPANSTNLLIPIKTRALQNKDPTVATNWGVQVGSNVYYSGLCGTSPCKQGLQILLLSRQNLSVVSNTSYEVDSISDYAQGSPLASALKAATGSVPGCVPGGCIMVMQSLQQIGFAPCYGTDLNICPNTSDDIKYFAATLMKLGASGSVLWANASSPAVAYSFIGNVGSGNVQNSVGGTQYERLGCSATRYQNPTNICDSLGDFNSSLNSPDDPAQTGALSGVLIRDNYNSFTYAPSAPQMTYTFGKTVVNKVDTNVVSINGSTTEGDGQYTMTLPSNSRGGFRLLILNRNDPTGNGCLSCTTGGVRYDEFFDIDTGLPDLINVISNGGAGTDANSLVFFAGFGDLSHSDEDTNTSATWDAMVNAVASFGADTMTLKILGDIHTPFNPPPNGGNSTNPPAPDDYLLVGRPIAFTEQFIAMPEFQGQESGYVILRHTLANATTPTTLEGVLVQDHEGYYTPHLQGLQRGLILPQTAVIAGASLLTSIGWPYTSTTGEQNAYSYLSNQLCCADIRATYVNQNASPENWLTQVYQLTYPSSQVGFTQADFNDVQTQLEIEFNYVSLVRNLQNNILNLYQSQQSNVALILQQAEDEVQSDIFKDTPPPVTPAAWSTFTTDVFPTLTNLAGFIPEGGTAIQTALGIGTLVVDSSVERSNDPNGNSQLMQALSAQDIAASQVAQYAVDQYTDSLITMGNDFNRILCDWGRLKTVGGPIASGQLQWDNAAQGYFLRAFNLTARRQYYPALIKVNSSFFVNHISYGDYQYFGSDNRNIYNGDEGCTQSDFHQGQDNGGFYEGGDFRGTAWYPGVIQSRSGDGANPGAYWWDIWALGLSPETNDHCPDPHGGYGNLPNTFGMFDKIDQNSTTGLGIWKAKFFNRWTGRILAHNNSYFGHVP